MYGDLLYPFVIAFSYSPYKLPDCPGDFPVGLLYLRPGAVLGQRRHHRLEGDQHRLFSGASAEPTSSTDAGLCVGV
jgi:hypothetical protein